MARLMQYNYKLFKCFNDVREILDNYVEFENEGDLFADMSEEGCKFDNYFKWKRNEDGSLVFPEEMKKFTERKILQTLQMPNEERDLVF